MRLRFLLALWLLIGLPICLRGATPAYVTSDLSIMPSNLLRSNILDSASVVWNKDQLGRMTANASSGLTNFIIASELWTNANISGTQVLIPTRNFTNDQVGVSNLMVLVNNLQYPGLFASFNATHALSVGATDFGWDRNFTATFLGDGRRGSLVLTNINANLSSMYPGNEQGVKDDADWNLGFSDARYLTVYAYEMNSGNSQLDFSSGSAASSHGIWFFNDGFVPGVFVKMHSEDGYIAPGDTIGVDLGQDGKRWRQIYTTNLTVSVGITNNGTYQHAVGAATGLLFVSSNANGVAYWTTNVNNIGVTNLSVYNNVIFNGSIVSNFNQDLNWTNDGAVLKGTTKGYDPRFALRFNELVGAGAQDAYNNLTNVGKYSFAVGSNVMARGMGSITFGNNNTIQTNANWSTIAGGQTNIIWTNAHSSFIGGGGRNRLTGEGAFNSVICGGTNNLVQMLLVGLGGMFIGGGGDNQSLSNYAAVVGGFGNFARSDYTFIGGGLNNQVSEGNQDTKAAIVAGEQNVITGGTHSLIGNGFKNGIGGTSTAGDFSFIGGGASNNIAPTGTANAQYGVIGGGADNNINGPATHVFIGGGNLNNASETNAVIAGGHLNAIGGIQGAARSAMILGGERNNINGFGEGNFIIGSSNLTTTNFVGIIGRNATNTTTPYAITIAPQGPTSQTIYTSSNTTFRTSFATVPDAIVTLTADNQVVDATLRTHIRLASDSAVAGDRTFVLTGTNVTQGAHAILEWTGTNAGELVDDAANSGTGNIRLSATWSPTQYDTLSLIFNGTDWIETARATN